MEEWKPLCQILLSLDHKITKTFLVLASPSGCDWFSAAAAAAKSLQSCSTLCDPIDGSPPGSSVPGILQARTLEWVAISFSNAWKWKVKVKSLSLVCLLATPWTAAYQAPRFVGFSRQEYWSGSPVPSPRTDSLLARNKMWSVCPPNSSVTCFNWLECHLHALHVLLPIPFLKTLRYHKYFF